MSENIPLDGQLDAKAIQKAKDMLSDGTPLFRAPGSGQSGPSEPVADVAERHMARENELAYKQNEVPQDRIDALRSAAAAENSEQIAQAYLDDARSLESIPARATAPREANRLESNAHLEQNRPIYEGIALEEATKAGHDVNFGGQHYPAQASEQPK